jgi:hypothetical protein
MANRRGLEERCPATKCGLQGLSPRWAANLLRNGVNKGSLRAGAARLPLLCVLISIALGILDKAPREDTAFTV